MKFSREEFDRMVDELICQTPVSFETLCVIAEKTLRPTVRMWCQTEDCLRGKDHVDDVMQEIHIRLIQTTVNYFLLRNGIQGAINDDPEGFEDWMFAVARNIKRDYANRIRGEAFRYTDPETIAPLSDDGGLGGEQQETLDCLKEAFQTALSFSVGIHKILTWLAQFVIVVGANKTKIESNEVILRLFEEKTLEEMYEGIRAASARIGWIAITEEQDERIRKALREELRDGVPCGEVPYREFFMKKDGLPNGKKSISDWANRMNDKIRQVMAESAQNQS